MDKSQYTIGEVCDILKCEQHTLRYMEKVLGLKVNRNEFLNRLYSEEDLSKFKMVLQLKEQGLNYSAIKKVIDQQGEIIEQEIQESRQDIVIQNKNLEQFIDMMQSVVEAAVEKAVGEKLDNMTMQLEEIKSANQELQQRIEEQQERHFNDLDNKLAKWREESKEQDKPKGFLSRFFK